MYHVDDGSNDITKLKGFIMCNSSLATVGFVESLVVLEDVGIAKLRVVRTGDSTEKHVVKFTVTDDSATSADDYTTPAKLEVQFEPGDNEEEIEFPIIDDRVVENPEVFTVKLVSEDPRVTVTKETATVTINDNDDGSAKSDSDYTVPSILEFTFKEGEKSILIPFPIIDDKLVEDTEDFALTLTSFEPEVTVSPDKAKVSILDND
ncbi:predicted protein, partial [Nematostella vectensis]